MDNRLQLQLIVWLLLVTVCAAGAKKREISYNVLGEGQKIFGKIGAEYTAKSSQECSLRCLADKECLAYKHTGTRQGNCLLIHCTDADHQIFESENSAYRKVSGKNGLRSALPMCWSGPEAVRYWSFDNTGGLIFIEGSTSMNSVPLVSGKVNKALTLNRHKRHWVDLGVHTDACMVRPETCGIAGGAISFWIKFIDCPNNGGIISSRGTERRGLLFHCRPTNIVFGIILQGGYFYVKHPKLSGWIHFALNYFGPNNGEGIELFKDGSDARNTTTRTPGNRSTPNGRLVVGRYYTNGNYWYASLQIDELFLFNHVLDSKEVQHMYESV